jgi:hypothetical protein
MAHPSHSSRPITLSINAGSQDCFLYMLYILMLSLFFMQAAE